MRVETNQKLVKRNTQIAQYLFFFSLAVLLIGFFVTNQQMLGVDPTSEDAATLALIIPSLVLPVGLISTLISVRMTNLWVRRPRPEEVIQEGLKGINKNSVLYNYYHFPARHVLIAPQGVFAIVTRFQDGRYTVDGGKWKTHRSPLSRVFSIFRLDGIGDPTFDAQQAAQKVKKQLEPIAPEIEVQPLIVFVDPRARLEITNPTVPVLTTDEKARVELKDYLRSLRDEPEEPEPVVKKGKKQPQPKKSQIVSSMPLTPEQIAAFEAATIRR